MCTAYSRERAVAVLAGKPDAAGLPCPTLIETEYAEIARVAHVLVGTWPCDPGSIAGSHELTFEVDQNLFCRAVSAKCWILYRVSSDTRETNLRLLHEIAHCLLRERFDRVTETDAWLLTAELAIPWAYIRGITPERAAELARVPGWFAQLCLRRRRAMLEGGSVEEPANCVRAHVS